MVRRQEESPARFAFTDYVKPSNTHRADKNALVHSSAAKRAEHSAHKAPKKCPKKTRNFLIQEKKNKRVIAYRREKKTTLKYRTWLAFHKSANDGHPTIRNDHEKWCFSVFCQKTPTVIHVLSDMREPPHTRK